MLRHVLADDGDAAAALVVLRRDEPALHETRLDGLHGTRATRRCSRRTGRRAFVGRRLSFDLQERRGVVVAERNRVGEARALDAGNLLRAPQQLVVERAPARFVVALLRDVHRRVQHVRGIEAQVDRLRALHAADEQPGRDEQHERDRDLRRRRARCAPAGVRRHRTFRVRLRAARSSGPRARRAAPAAARRRCRTRARPPRCSRRRASRTAGRSGTADRRAAGCRR